MTVTDKNDVTLAYEAVTDSTGAYSFENIPISEYEAVCATPTVDGRSTICTTDIQPVDFKVTEGAAAEVNFGYVIPTGSIAGYVWEDQNESGTFEEDEPYIRDLTVTVTDKLDTDKVYTARTNENGNFSVDNLSIGEYTVNIETPILYGQEGTCTTNNQTVDVIVSADATVKVEAGFYAPIPTPEPTAEPTVEPTTEPTATPKVRRSSGGGTGRPSNVFVPATAVPILATAEPTAEPEPAMTTKPELDRENHYAYIIGYPDGSVRPSAEISRAEVATIFFRMLSDKSRAELWSSGNSYADVTAENWYNNAVSTLTNAGIVNGDNETTFRPDAAITRAEFAAIAARFTDSLYLDKDMFSDNSGHWASEYINTAAFLGWIHGYEDGTFRPDNLITRAEAMTLINNVLDRRGDEMLDDMVTWTDNTDASAWYYEAVQEATNSHYFEKRDKTEKWTAIRAPRDWSALENELSTASSAGSEPSVIEGRKSD